jgi:hypothetical protein
VRSGEGVAVHPVLKAHVHRRHLVLLLPLHATVLEPNLNLALSQPQRMRDLDPAASETKQIYCRLEFLHFETECG